MIKKIYFYLILHLLIGILGIYLKPIILLYPIIVFIIGIYYVIINKNKNNEVLIVASYIIGMEVFLRMTNSFILYEIGKYGVLFFMLLGIFFRGINYFAIIYFIVLLLLIPSIIVSFLEFSNDVNIRKSIIFNLLGPITLITSSFYTINTSLRKIQLQKILITFGLPLLSILTYVILYNPLSNELFIFSESILATSGGFGPNQVSTVLGFGMFVFFSLFLYFSKGFLQKLLYVILTLLFTYRALLTFSRGGLLTGILMIIFLLAITYFKVNTIKKLKLQLVIFTTLLVGFLIFSYTILVTDGMITNRYTGKDAKGREKSSKFTGRDEIAAAEFQLFLENPILGVGVGRNQVEKTEILGRDAATHNEITRLLAEHGTFGLIAFLIMFFTPLVYFMFNRNQIFVIPFFLFWFLTINHAALRIAAPAFVYALSLLRINWKE